MTRQDVAQRRNHLAGQLSAALTNGNRTDEEVAAMRADLALIRVESALYSALHKVRRGHPGPMAPDLKARLDSIYDEVMS